MIIIGTDRISRYIKLEDLYITYETLKMLMRISEENIFEYIGLIKHNNNRYIKLSEETPIIEMYKGKSSYNTALISSQDESQFDKAILNFHTHLYGKGKVIPEETSNDDCSAFGGLFLSTGARFHAVISKDKILILDFSDVKQSQVRECYEKNNSCECMKEIGVKKYILDGTEDILLVS